VFFASPLYFSLFLNKRPSLLSRALVSKNASPQDFSRYAIPASPTVSTQYVQNVPPVSTRAIRPFPPSPVPSFSLSWFRIHPPQNSAHPILFAQNFCRAWGSSRHLHREVFLGVIEVNCLFGLSEGDRGPKLGGADLAGSSLSNSRTNILSPPFTSNRIFCSFRC